MTFLALAGRAEAAPKAAPASATTVKDTGSPKLPARWVISQPPYPVQAARAHEQGDVLVEVTTDATGKVVKATTPKPTKHPNLDAAAIGWAKVYWHGPANTKAKIPLKFRVNY